MFRARFDDHEPRRRGERMEGAAHGHPRMTVLTLALAAGVASSGCVDPGIDCWTREDYRTAVRIPGDPAREIRAGTYRGEVVIEDPDNWWTGAHFTGEACRMEVEHRPRWDVRPNALPGCSGEAACADRRGGQSVLLRRDGGREVGGPATPPGPPRFTDADALPGGRNTELRSLREAGSAVPRVSRRTRVEKRGATSPAHTGRRRVGERERERSGEREAASRQV